jgi:hypothetical protein
MIQDSGKMLQASDKMLQASDKMLQASSYKSVNLPESIKVEEDAAGLPLAVRMAGRQPVASIEDRWRIDDEWWRAEAISRMYYSIMFKSGQKVVVYKDLVNGGWYRQGY